MAGRNRLEEAIKLNMQTDGQGGTAALQLRNPPALAAGAPTLAITTTETPVKLEPTGHAAKTESSRPTKRLEDLLAMSEFQQDLRQIADCDARSRSDQFRIGELAHKWIGDNRYSRILNADRFAKLLNQHTAMKRTGRQIRNYIGAFLEHRLHEQHGEQFSNLEPSHLARIASSRLSENDRLELANRANQQQASVSDIKTLAVQLQSERTRKSRKLEVVLADPVVRHMDGLDLLKEQADGSVECLIADWPWSKCCQRADLPRPFCPKQPIAHLILCLEQASAKLAPQGLILLHYTSCSFLRCDLVAAVGRSGFKHAGEFAWRKLCGAFQNSDSPLMNGHEIVILLCRNECMPKSCCGGISSVSPKWAAPARANSGVVAVHPFQKPVELYEKLIAVATVNGLVVDAYAGSGTAGIAAVRLGCSYLGAEMVPEYVKIANHRIAMAKGENEEVLDAVNFITNGAGAGQLATIKTALAKCNLNVVQDWTEGGK